MKYVNRGEVAANPIAAPGIPGAIKERKERANSEAWKPTSPT
jgi:hypothetical protein